MALIKAPHTPVMLDEVLDYLAPKKGDRYLDLTAGYGGHAAAVLERTLNQQDHWLVDRDPAAASYLQASFKGRATVQNSDFLTVSRQLFAADQRFDVVLADLGVSTAQLEDAERGLSFRLDGPLDMRLDNRQKVTAQEVLNRLNQKQLATLLRRFGEEPRANRIAAEIVRRRPLERTGQLAAAAAAAWPGKRRLHPATRSFQAIRIAVNEELDQLATALPLWLELLSPGGRLAVISFHSLEDRLVKQVFKRAAEGLDASVTLLSRRPVRPRASEIALNPRARSAKLRPVVKIKTAAGTPNRYRSPGKGSA